MNRLSVYQKNELGLMLDIGRKYFSPKDLFRLIDQMHGLGFNLLHLHFSENERFGLESDYLKRDLQQEILTKSELIEVVDYATAKSIAVMGEIGMPGHMGAILRQYPEFRLVGSNGQPIETALNVSDKQAVALCKGLIQELSPFFNSSYWHLGADEYLSAQEFGNNGTLRDYAQTRLGPMANAQDSMLLFLNLLGYFLGDLGLRPRVWGDSLSNGAVMHVNSEYLIDWWTERSPLEPGRNITPALEFAKLGHRLVNCSWDPCYYVLHKDSQVAKGFSCQPDLELSEQNWEVDHFRGSSHGLSVPLIEGYESHFAGVKMQVWCDHPSLLSASEVIEAILPQMQFISRKYHDYQSRQSG